MSFLEPQLSQLPPDGPERMLAVSVATPSQDRDRDQCLRSELCCTDGIASCKTARL